MRHYLSVGCGLDVGNGGIEILRFQVGLREQCFERRLELGFGFDRLLHERQDQWNDGVNSGHEWRHGPDASGD